MSANVDTMMSVREVPWHGEGVVLGEYPGSWAEARKQAGLDWEPISLAMYGLDIDEQGNAVYTPDEGWSRNVRSDNGYLLSVTRESYHLINHETMGEVIETILDQPNVKYETAGSLDMGRRVWCLVKLDEPFQLPGDDSLIMPYVALQNRHDAMGSLTARATSVRIVCANTWTAADMEGDRTGAVYAFRHSANWRARVDEARDAITGARKQIIAYRDIAEGLLKVPVTPAQRELFVREFIPAPEDGIISDRVAANIETARNAVRGILTSITTDQVKDTAYGLVQAAGEYLDHVRAYRSRDTYLGRTLLKPEPLKGKAMRLALQVAKADVLDQRLLATASS